MQTLDQLNAGQLIGCKHLKLVADLHEFPMSIIDLADTLEVLDLSGNHLSSLPDEFASLTKLKIIFLSNNQFDHLPEVLGKCPQLEMIGFKANQISTVSESSIPQQTRWLILTDNQIEQLPDSIGQCHRLEKLALAGNKLTSLPESLANCRQLGLIRLSANQLIDLPDWLFTLPKLAWLAFSGNRFSHVDACTNNSVPRLSTQDLQLGELLGQGASGLIYQAKLTAQWQEKLDKQQDVAVKMFKGFVTSDGYPADELDCCLTAGDHPNLIKVLAQINQADQLGLVMELIPKSFSNLGLPPSLASCTRDTFEEGTQFSWQQIHRIGLQMADILQHLHQNGVSHGDIYAHNTMVNTDNKVLFGDFGAASNLANLPTIQRQTMQWIEVNALGCLLDDMLTLIDDNTSIMFTTLNGIAQSCMDPVINQRPTFASIKQTLLALN